MRRNFIEKILYCRKNIEEINKHTIQTKKITGIILHIIENFSKEYDHIEVPLGEEKYIGELDQLGKRVGFGKYIYRSGAIYLGYWKNGERNGIGKCIFTSGNTYNGYWKVGKRCGFGEFYFYQSQEKYFGEFNSDLRNGFGYMEKNKEVIFEGNWKRNKKNGNYKN
jgi:hypothetical protein